MSRRRKVGISILTVMAGILLVGMVGVFFLMEGLRGLGGFDDSGNTSAWDVPEGGTGLSSQDDTGRLIAAWVIPHRDDALALSCVIAGDTSYDGSEDSFMPEHLWLLGLPPIVNSFELLPTEG